MKSPRIIFFGTPEFSVPSFNILINNNYNIVAAVTSLDNVNTRDKANMVSPVKKVALKNNILTLQPQELTSQNFIQQITDLKPDINVVVAFKLLPESIWSLPNLGSFNLHASLLPQYRGAAPINWAIINNEKETGLTTFFLNSKMDAGNIIFQEKEEITPYDTAGTLHDRLKIKGADLVLKTVKAIENKDYLANSQDNISNLKKAPKINAKLREINWNNTSTNIINLIRGLSPYPGAFTKINNKIFKILEASHNKYDKELLLLNPGEMISKDNKHIYIGTQDGYISIDLLQLEGGKRMDAKSYLMGNII